MIYDLLKKSEIRNQKSEIHSLAYFAYIYNERFIQRII